jgi:hypothetical protein
LASSILIGAPPKETPFLTKAGRVSDAWLAWLSSIISTGAVVQNLQVLDIIAEDTATDGNSGAVYHELADSFALQSQAPRAPESAAFDLPEPRLDLRSELAELRALIAMGEPAPFGALGSAAFQATAAFDAAGAASAVQASSLQRANNLSDVANPTTSLSNLMGGYVSWTPSITPSGSMTVSGVTGYAQYIRHGQIVTFYLALSMTLAGTASNTMQFSLPIASAGLGIQALSSAVSSPAGSFGYSFAYAPAGGTAIACYVNSGANYTLGTNTFYISGSYRVA